MLPLAALAALGSAGGIASKGLPYLVGVLSPEGQAEARQAKADIDALNRNEFGPSRAQQERMVQDALALARSQAQSARAEANRQAAASSYRGPDTTALKITEAATKQAGGLRMQAADNAAALAAKAKQDALARVKARKEETVAALQDITGGAVKGALMGAAGAQGADFTTLLGAYGVDTEEEAKKKAAAALAAGGKV